MSKAQGKYALGICDRTGFTYPLADLVEEYVQGKPTGLRVGKDMADPDHPQNFLGVIDHPADAQALNDPRPDSGQDESRRLFSFNPVGLGNTVMTMGLGRVTVGS